MVNSEIMRNSIEIRRNGFKCLNCKIWVPINKLIGTKHRNHCPTCLWSKHVDLNKSGDRKSLCRAGMKPLGLTFKQEGIDKYGKEHQGELMLIHKCTNQDCGKITINRIAGDDNTESILRIFEQSQNADAYMKNLLIESGIKMLSQKDIDQIKLQLFGKQA